MAPVAYFGPVALPFPLGAQFKFFGLDVVESALQPEDFGGGHVAE